MPYDPIQAFLQSLGAGTPGNMLPGGGVLGRLASTPGAPGMGYPGTINPVELGGSSLFNLPNFNPWARAAIAGAQIMQPTPTANDPAPTNAWMQRPSGVGGMPGPAGPLAASSAVVDAVPTGSFQLGHNAPPAVTNAWSDRPSGQPGPPPVTNAWSDRPSGQPGPPPVYAPAIPPPRPSDLGAPTRAKKRIDPAKVNLGYYAPTSGNVRAPPSMLTPYTDPNDPRIFKGALSA